MNNRSFDVWGLGLEQTYRFDETEKNGCAVLGYQARGGQSGSEEGTVWGF